MRTVLISMLGRDVLGVGRFVIKGWNSGVWETNLYIRENGGWKKTYGTQYSVEEWQVILASKIYEPVTDQVLIEWLDGEARRLIAWDEWDRERKNPDEKPPRDIAEAKPYPVRKEWRSTERFVVAIFVLTAFILIGWVAWEALDTYNIAVQALARWMIGG